MAKIDRQLVRVEDLYQADAVCYLTLEGLAHCDGSSKDVQNIIDTAALFAKHYIDKKGSATITSEEIKYELGLSELEVQRVCEMYWRIGWPLTSGGGRSNEGKNSNFNINRNALLFDGVKTLDDFKARVKNAAQKEEAERKLNVPVYQPSSVADIINKDDRKNVGNKPKPFYKRWKWSVPIALLGIIVAALPQLKSIYDSQPRIYVSTELSISGFKEDGLPTGKFTTIFKNVGSTMVSIDPGVTIKALDKKGKATKDGDLMFRTRPLNPNRSPISITPQVIQPGEEVTAEGSLMDLSEIAEPIEHVVVKYATTKGQECNATIPLSTFFSSNKINLMPGTGFGLMAGAKSHCQWSF
ncbi:MAG: hypothetical protein ACYC7L_06255 [Nitrospirota bacterium]